MKRWLIAMLCLIAAVTAYATDPAPVSIQQMMQGAPKETSPSGQTSIITVRGGTIRRFSLMSTARLVPAATTSTLGAVKVGTGLAVDTDGTISTTGVSGVSSFKGRGGAVLPQSGDYSIGQISGAATVAGTGSYADLSNAPAIPSALSQLSEDTTHRTVTDTEKATWEAKANANAVAPITASRGIFLLSSTGCGAGWQTTMASEISQYTARGIQSDHIICYPYTPATGSASFTFPSVAATGAVGTMTAAYTADASFSFPAVSGTGAVGTFTAAAGASGDASFTFPSVSGDGAAGVLTASYTQDGSFTFPAVTATGAVGTLTVAAASVALPYTFSYDAAQSKIKVVYDGTTAYLTTSTNSAGWYADWTAPTAASATVTVKGAGGGGNGDPMSSGLSLGGTGGYSGIALTATPTTFIVEAKGGDTSANGDKEVSTVTMAATTYRITIGHGGGGGIGDDAGNGTSYTRGTNVGTTLTLGSGSAAGAGGSDSNGSPGSDGTITITY